MPQVAVAPIGVKVDADPTGGMAIIKEHKKVVKDCKFIPCGTIRA